MDDLSLTLLFSWYFWRNFHRNSSCVSGASLEAFSIEGMRKATQNESHCIQIFIIRDFFHVVNLLRKYFSLCNKKGGLWCSLINPWIISLINHQRYIQTFLFPYFTPYFMHNAIDNLITFPKTWVCRVLLVQQ